MTSNSHLEQAKGGGWCTAATWAAAATVREHGGGAANLQEMASQIFVRAAWKRITGSGSAVGFASWALEATAAVGSAARRSRMIVPESRRESRLSAPQKGTVCVLTPQGISKGGANSEAFHAFRRACGFYSLPLPFAAWWSPQGSDDMAARARTVRVQPSRSKNGSAQGARKWEG